MRDLAALTGLVFVILTIPFQFDVIWLSLGWLLQGTALCIYGILKNKRRVMYAGVVIFSLCIGAFLLVDIWHAATGVDGFHFGFRYLSVTVGSLLVLAALVFRSAVIASGPRTYKYAVMLNLWFYLLYVTVQVEARVAGISPFNISYMAWVVRAVVTFILAFGFLRFKPLFDSGMRALAFVLYFTSVAGLFILNFALRPLLVPFGSGHALASAGATVVILFTAATTVYCVYDALKRFVARGKLRLDHMYVVIALCILVVVTQNLIFNYGLRFDSWMISVVFVFAALAWVVYGFYNKVVLLRRYGLALALITVVKVFIIDLTGLTQGQRIVSFFVMGAVLVGISFVYQLFSKRLELKVEKMEKEQ